MWANEEQLEEGARRPSSERLHALVGGARPSRLISGLRAASSENDLVSARLGEHASQNNTPRPAGGLLYCISRTPA